MRHRLLAGVGAGAGLLLAVTRQREEFETYWALLVSAPRTARTLWWATQATLDYCASSSFAWSPVIASYSAGSHAAADSSALAQVHERQADRLVELCLANGGIYIKAAQLLSTYGDLPECFNTKLAALQDRGQAVPYSEIKAIVEGELGFPLHVAFPTFEAHPCGVASIAQVHRATLPDHTPVAVKVQLPNITQGIRADLVTLAGLTSVAGWLFPDFPLDWAVRQLLTRLQQELDFRREADNARRVARGLPRGVVVPLVYDSHSTGHVLTMEYVEGLKLSDACALRRCGVDPREAGLRVLAAYSRMAHVAGFVHGDPHPGNILLRPLPVREGEISGSQWSEGSHDAWGHGASSGEGAKQAVGQQPSHAVGVRNDVAGDDVAGDDFAEWWAEEDAGAALAAGWPREQECRQCDQHEEWHTSVSSGGPAAWPVESEGVGRQQSVVEHPKSCPGAAARQFEVVLLDHGYCVELPTWVRHVYCRLWCAVVLGDQAAALEVGRQLVGDDAEAILPVLFRGTGSRGAERQGEAPTHSQRGGSASEGGQAAEFAQFMDLVPQPLSETLRVLGGVRGLVGPLGVGVPDRIQENARNALAGLRDGAGHGADGALPAVSWWFEAKLMARVRAFALWQRTKATANSALGGAATWWRRCRAAWPPAWRLEGGVATLGGLGG